MFARFLEVSVSSADIAQSVSFYDALGFRQLSVGEVWHHPYAVFSDGRLHIGIHQYEFDSPAVTFVRPDLAADLDDLKARGIHFEFQKTGDDEFNEVGFLDPGGQMVTVLEARTYSPASDGRSDASLLGHLDHIALPAVQLPDSAAFWYRLGLDDVPDAHLPDNEARVGSGEFRLGLYEAAPLSRLAAVYIDHEIETRLAKLRAAGFSTGPNRLARGAPGASIHSPEGLDFLLTGRE